MDLRISEKKNTKSGLDHNGLNEITTKIICDDKLFLYFYNINL